MELCELSNIIEAVTANYLTPSLEECLPNTVKGYAIVSAEDEIFAYVGVMQQSLLDPQCYLWAVLCKGANYTIGDLREAKPLITELINQFTMPVMAEADVYSWTDNRFLQFCGFEITDSHSGRNIYKWRTN